MNSMKGFEVRASVNRVAQNLRFITVVY